MRNGSSRAPCPIPPPRRTRCAGRLLAGEARAPDRNGRLDRPPRRRRIPARPPLPEAQHHPRHRPLHGGKPLAPPRPADRRGRRSPARRPGGGSRRAGSPRRELRTRAEAASDTGSDDFVTVVLDNLAKSGVQNTKKNERRASPPSAPGPAKATSLPKPPTRKPASRNAPPSSSAPNTAPSARNWSARPPASAATGPTPWWSAASPSTRRWARPR